MSTLSASHRSRGLALVLAALLCLPLFAAPAVAAKEGDDANVAEAVNEKDGSSVFDVAFEVRRVSSGVVDQTNAAVAYANCESCQTVAIAIQIVLVAGGADTVTPTNVAVALNENCVTCQTLAVAYQFVFGTGDVLEFTKEGRKMLKDIRKELNELGKSGRTVDEIRASTEALRLRIQDLLATELVPREGKEESSGDEEPGDPATERDDPRAGDPAASEDDEELREDDMPQETSPQDGVPQEDVPDDGQNPAEEPPPRTEPEPTESAPATEPSAPATP